MKTKVLFIPSLLIAMFLISWQNASAHCEIPCGIYGDSLRIQEIEEHITTIEKSMNQIKELSAESDKNYNQLIRWVTNKDEHAKKIQDIVAQYFLHQRIKPVDKSDSEAYEKYITRLTLLHKLQVYAMKAKQTTDLEHVDSLRKTLQEFADSYFHTH